MTDRPSPLLSVWPTGQRDLLAQLRDAGCVSGTEIDIDRISPAVAAHAIATYTRPGDLVLDPDCGTGTVLTEALRAGRQALGLTAHDPWWTIARANITAAKAAGGHGDGSVLDARPEALATTRAAGLIGRVGLVLTALRTGPDRGRVEAAIAEFATSFQYCEPLLRSGGLCVVVARPLRHADGSLVDLITPLVAAGSRAGLVPVARCIALTAGLRGSRLVTGASLAERRAATSAAGPVVLTAHREVLVFQRAHDAELAAEVGATILSPPEERAIRITGDGAEFTGGRRPA